MGNVVLWIKTTMLLYHLHMKGTGRLLEMQNSFIQEMETNPFA